MFSPFYYIFGGWGWGGSKFQNCRGTASKNAEGLLIADHPSESILPLRPPSLNPNKSETRMTACISKQDQIMPISLYVTIMPIFFQTLEALNTPEVKPEKHIFIFHNLTVALSLDKGAYPEKFLTFWIVILNLHSF